MKKTIEYHRTVLLVPFLLNKIPYASVVAILLITGFNLTEPKLLLNMWSLGWKQFVPFINHHKMMIADFKKRLYVALILTIPIMVLSTSVCNY